jgi:hypothetical protein
MRRVPIILAAALWLALPTVSRAQYNDTDRQAPKEYHDEDSQPLALIADALYPIGFALEWVVTRPLHWITSDSPVAPVYRPVGGNDNSPPPPVPIIPDNTMDEASTSPVPQDWSPTRKPITLNATVIHQADQSAGQPMTAPLPSNLPPSTVQPSSGQPALH